MVLPLRDMSEASLTSVEDLLDMTFGDEITNTVDFRMLHVILKLLARSMSVLERQVYVKITDAHQNFKSVMSITEMKIHGKGKKKKKSKKPKEAEKSKKRGKGGGKTKKGYESDESWSESDSDDEGGTDARETKRKQYDEYYDADGRKGHGRGKRARQGQDDRWSDDDYFDEDEGAGGKKRIRRDGDERRGRDEEGGRYGGGGRAGEGGRHGGGGRDGEGGRHGGGGRDGEGGRHGGGGRDGEGGRHGGGGRDGEGGRHGGGGRDGEGGRHGGGGRDGEGGRHGGGGRDGEGGRYGGGGRDGEGGRYGGGGRDGEGGRHGGGGRDGEGGRYGGGRRDGEGGGYGGGGRDGEGGGYGGGGRDGEGGRYGGGGRVGEGGRYGGGGRDGEGGRYGGGGRDGEGGGYGGGGRDGEGGRYGGGGRDGEGGRYGGGGRDGEGGRYGGEGREGEGGRYGGEGRGGEGGRQGGWGRDGEGGRHGGGGRDGEGGGYGGRGRDGEGGRYGGGGRDGEGGRYGGGGRDGEGGRYAGGGRDGEGGGYGGRGRDGEGGRYGGGGRDGEGGRYGEGGRDGEGGRYGGGGRDGEGGRYGGGGRDGEGGRYGGEGRDGADGRYGGAGRGGEGGRYGRTGSPGEEMRSEKLIVVTLTPSGQGFISPTSGQRRPMSIATREDYERLLAQVMELRKLYGPINIPGFEIFEEMYQQAMFTDPIAILQLSARLEYTERAIHEMTNFLLPIATNQPQHFLKDLSGSGPNAFGKTDAASKGAPDAVSFASKGGQVAGPFASKGGQDAVTFASKGGQDAVSFAPKGGQDAVSFASKGGQDAVSYTSKGGPDTAAARVLFDFIGGQDAVSHASKIKGKDGASDRDDQSVASKKRRKSGALQQDSDDTLGQPLYEVLEPEDNGENAELSSEEESEHATKDPNDLVDPMHFIIRLQWAQRELPKMAIAPSRTTELMANDVIKAARDMKANLDKAVSKAEPRLDDFEEASKNYMQIISGMDARFTTTVTAYQEELSEMQQSLEYAIDAMAEALANREPDQDAIDDLHHKFNTLSSDLNSTYEVQLALDRLLDEMDVDLLQFRDEVIDLRNMKSTRREVELALMSKASVGQLNGKMTKVQFGAAHGELQKSISIAFDKFNNTEVFWQKTIDNLDRECREKANKVQVNSFKDDIANKIAIIRDRLDFMLSVVGDPRSSGDEHRLVERTTNCLCCGTSKPKIAPKKETVSISSESSSESMITVRKRVVKEKKEVETDGGGDREVCYPHKPVKHPVPLRTKDMRPCMRICGEPYKRPFDFPRGDVWGISSTIDITRLKADTEYTRSMPKTVSKPCLPCNEVPAKRRVRRRPRRLARVESVAKKKSQSEIDLGEGLEEDEGEGEGSIQSLERYLKYSMYWKPSSLVLDIEDEEDAVYDEELEPGGSKVQAAGSKVQAAGSKVQAAGSKIETNDELKTVVSKVVSKVKAVVSKVQAKDEIKPVVSKVQAKE